MARLSALPVPMLLAFLALACDKPAAQQPSPPPVRTEDPYTSPRTHWYRDARYGMFIHWGIYAVPAGEWKGNRPKDAGEWIMHHQKIPIAEYEPLAKQFNPVKFDARQWVAVAKDAGMKYVVITSKHHDGFCMWDTDVTDYNVVDATPWKRDPMKELSEACKEAGIRFAFYHSIMDWHHPEQAIPAAALGKRLWETCMTLNDTWGYKHFDQHWKQPKDVCRKLADIAGKGGNFLLNVGPTAEGEIPPESVRILREAGVWVKANEEALFGTTFALAAPPKWGSVTRRGNQWYLIVFDWPKDGKLAVPAASKVKAARLLAGGGDVAVGAVSESGVELTLPAQKPAEPAAVVVLEFEGAGEPIAPGRR
jgi:hypothetical protein